MRKSILFVLPAFFLLAACGGVTKADIDSKLANANDKIESVNLSEAIGDADAAIGAWIKEKCEQVGGVYERPDCVGTWPFD